MIQARLIKNTDTKVLLLTIRFRHLKECVYFTNCWNVLRNERLQFRFQINLLGLVTSDVLKHFFEILRNRQVRILVRVICSRDFFFIFIVIFVILLLLLSSHLSSHVLLLILLLLLLGSRLHVDIDFVFFLVRVDFFRIVDIDG